MAKMIMVNFKDNYRLISVSVVSLFCLPFLARAQTVRGIFQSLTDIVKLVIPVLMSVCVAVFILGIVRFIASAGNPEKVQKAKSLIIWGLVGVFVLVSFWGLIQVLLSTFFGSSVPPGPGSVPNWPPQAFP